MRWRLQPFTGDLTVEQVYNFFVRELSRLSGVLAQNPVEVYTAEPPKPYDGQMVIADGTNWDPGSGAGYYGYYNGSWRFLG